MNSSFTVTGLSTGIIRPHDPFTDRIIAAADAACGGFADGDILVLAETAVALPPKETWSGSSTITPSPRAQELAGRYHMDSRTVEVVLAESDEVVGGIPGFLLCMKQGTLLPNAGVDASNTPRVHRAPAGRSRRKRRTHKRRDLPPVPCPDRGGCRRQPDARDASRVLRCGHRLRRHHFRHRRSGAVRPVRPQTGSDQKGGRRQYRIGRRTRHGRGRRMHTCRDRPGTRHADRGSGGVDTIDADECLFMGVFRNNRT